MDDHPRSQKSSKQPSEQTYNLIGWRFIRTVIHYEFTSVDHRTYVKCRL